MGKSGIHVLQRNQQYVQSVNHLIGIRKDKMKSPLKINYTEKAKLLPEYYSCLFCGDEEHNLITHHVNEDRDNNEFDNLMVLCKSCHAKIHLRINDIIKKYGINKKRLKKPFSTHKSIRNLINAHL